MSGSLVILLPGYKDRNSSEHVSLTHFSEAERRPASRSTKLYMHSFTLARSSPIPNRLPPALALPLIAALSLALWWSLWLVGRALIHTVF